MMTLQEFLEKQFDEELMLAVLSGQRSKEKDVPSRVRIRPIELKGSVCYQAGRQHHRRQHLSWGQRAENS